VALKKNSKTDFALTEYKVEISFSPEDEAYIATVPELPGCASHGDTPKEALKMAFEAVELYLEVLQKSGKEIPLPMTRKKFSGKIPLRIDPLLHRDISVKADNEKISLNKYIERVLKTGT